MEGKRGLLVLLGLLLVMIGIQGRGSESKLVENFYSSTCPNVEAIVKQAVFTKLGQTLTTVAGTLRLFFHDCFIEGCDASIMIATADGDVEKDYSDNLSLAGDGFDTVIKGKQAVEVRCPGVVSCADSLALATPVVVVLAGGPSFNVELGRRDGLISKASRVPGNLPEPFFNLKQLNTMFAKHNLSQTDVIALSGAYSLGVSNCSHFKNRLNSFPSVSGVDPSLDPSYAKQLMSQYPKNVNTRRPPVFFDPQTPQTFDNLNYKNLVAGKGLLTSDEVLFTDTASKPTVRNFASNPGNRAFIMAMRKLGRVAVHY